MNNTTHKEPKNLTSPSPIKVEPNETKTNEKFYLFQTPIPTYTDSESIIISHNNENLKTSFHKTKFQPFGFYLPENMKVFLYHDGENFGLNEANYVQIGHYDNHVEKLNEKNEQLTQFHEYIASEKKYDLIVDYFVFEHLHKKYLIRFYYLESDQDSVLPLFLSFIQNIRYIEK